MTPEQQHDAGRAELERNQAAERSRKVAAAREELAADIAALKSLGIKSFKGSGIEVEFFPLEPVAEKVAKQVDVEMCACGHHKHIAHTNGMCVEGCTEEQCNPKEKA
jgi:hypothetical protein